MAFKPDRDVQVEAISKTDWLQTIKTTQTSFSERPYILEVKHDGQVPAWLTSFLKARQIPESCFSKYCYAMSFSLIEAQAPATETINLRKKKTFHEHKLVAIVV